METLLPNVNTSEGCFDIGVLLSARGTVKTKNSVMGGFSVSGVNC